jgi:hypothetical protein
MAKEVIVSAVSLGLPLAVFLGAEKLLKGVVEFEPDLILGVELANLMFVLGPDVFASIARVIESLGGEFALRERTLH